MERFYQRYKTGDKNVYEGLDMPDLIFFRNGIKGYDDIVNSCTKAWNCFISDTKRVIKMCTRAWASVGTN